MRYKMTLCYDGSDFCGWQIQPHSPSVQGELERCLGVLLHAEVAVTGAGRTDTGVNASFYVAHFDCDGEVDCGRLCARLNGMLPASVAVFSIEQVDDAFHARFGARKREYTYFLHRCKDPFAGRTSYLYSYPDVDFAAMNRAAEALLGTHDFSCFEKSGGDNKTSICTVTKAVWEPVRDGSDQYWKFTIAADRFLRNMVRAVVGTLLEVGRGKRQESDFAALVLPPDTCAMKGREVRRSLAGESVPGHALFLSGIEY